MISLGAGMRGAWNRRLNEARELLHLVRKIEWKIECLTTGSKMTLPFFRGDSPVRGGYFSYLRLRCRDSNKMVGNSLLNPFQILEEFRANFFGLVARLMKPRSVELLKYSCNPQGWRPYFRPNGYTAAVNRLWPS